MVRIFLADSAIRPEQIDAIRAQLPTGWALSDVPDGVVAILTEHADVTEEALAACAPTLRLVLRLEFGRATVAPTAVSVVDLPNTALVGVAEHTVGLIMALSRQLLWVARQTAAQQWLPDRNQPMLTDQTRYVYNWIGLEDFGTLYRRTVGLVGLGKIGCAVATRLRAFGVRVLYTQRHRLEPAEEARLGVRWREFDDLLRESEIVSLHHRFQEGPDGNDRQFGAREFALMRPTAFFVNTSRGRMVDEEALVAALRAGQIAGAGLDVFRYEPLPPDHPLLSLAGENIILTAHVAGAPMTDAWRTTAEELVERVTEALS